MKKILITILIITMGGIVAYYLFSRIMKQTQKLSSEALFRSVAEINNNEKGVESQCSYSTEKFDCTYTIGAGTALGTASGRIALRADLDGDGSEDAVVQKYSCGASCSGSTEVILNQNGKARNIGFLIYKPSKEVAPYPKMLQQVRFENGILTVIFQNIAQQTDETRYKIVGDKIITL
jgi:hypothetical protein